MDSVDSGNWIQFVGGLSSLGFAVWYAWYVTTRTIPDLHARNDATIRALVSEFRGDVQQMRSEYATLSREGHEAISKMSDAVSELSIAVRELKG